MSNPPPPATAEAPDPDEDDLSDLDDVLDAFDSKPTLPVEPKPSASGPGRPAYTLPVDTSAPIPGDATAEEGEDAGLSQLERGMSDLLSQIDANPEMQKQFEEMMAELILAGEGGASLTPTATTTRDATAPAAPGTGAKKETDFNSTIRRTMERMQASSEAATASTSTKSEEDLLMEMLNFLGSPGGGAGSEDDFNAMLLNMMSQLVHKDILYDPMKELDDKFPGWMEKNKDKVAQPDWERYELQARLVREIVARFEKPEYSDENAEDKEFIVERMQKMQEAGSPPSDLVGDMSNLAAAQEGLGDLDAGCPTQ